MRQLIFYLPSVKRTSEKKLNSFVNFYFIIIAVLNPFVSENYNMISIKSYLKHMVKNANINSENLINMLIYIDRLCKKNKIMLNYSNIYKIILSALVIALKYNEDHYFTNRYYSSIGGIRNKDLNLIEYHFLTLIDFSLYIKPSEYSRYYTNLSRLLKLKQ